MATFQDNWQAAQQLLEKHEWSTAASQLEELYQEQQSVALNQDLVLALMKTKQFVAAYNYAIEYQTAYLATPQLFDRYVQLGLANQAFIPLREFILSQPDLSVQKTALTRVITAEKKMQQGQGAKVDLLAKQFYHLSDVSIVMQQARLEDANQLPLQQYLLGARFLLVDPFVHPLVRVTILDQLRRLQISQATQFQWLDEQQYAVVPSQLISVEAGRIFQKTLQALKEQFGKSDPIFMDGMTDELRLQFLYLYPFPEKAVLDVDDWLEILVNAKKLPSRDKLSTKRQQMLVWQQKIEKFNQKLTAE